MIPLCATQDRSVQRQSSRARRRVFRLANYEIRIELKISRLQKKIAQNVSAKSASSDLKQSV